MPSAPFVSFFLSTIIHFHTHSLFPLPFLSLLPFFLSFFLPFLSPFFSSFLSFSLSSRFLLPLLSLPFLVIPGNASPNALDCLMMLIVFLPFSLFLCGECLWESHALSSPFPFPLCVPRLSSPLCVHPFPCLVLSSPHVCGGCHTPTLYPAVLLALQSSLSVSLPPPSPLFTPCVCETSVCGQRERG